MPRQVAPQPHDEFRVKLTKPFSGTAQTIIEILGEPNRSANIKRTTRTGNGNELHKTGDMGADDVTELLTLVHQLTGLPSDPDSDIFGADTVLELQTMELQWSNKEGKPAGDTIEPGEDGLDTFRRVAESVEGAAKEFAKKDAAI